MAAASGMSSISKEEYLKRYLSNDSSKEKKKKRKVKTSKQSNVRIIDDDADFKIMDKSDSKAEDPEDDAPTIAEVVDERPEHVKRLEEYRKNQRWKVIGKDKEKDDLSSKEYGVITMNKAANGSSPGSDSRSSIQRRKRHDSDSDTSPVRRKRHDSDSDPSPVRRRRHDSDSDSSSSHRNKVPTTGGGKTSSHRLDTKRQARVDDTVLKSKKKRHDSDSDQSPVRRQEHDSDDQSPARRQRHNSDQSPPRRQRHDSDSDQSPPRRQVKGGESDQSPPRRKKHQSDSDQSPPRKKTTGDESDQSPPRKRRHDSDSDQSPPRKSKWDSNQSPPRKRKPGHNSSQSSPRRKRRGSDSDSSPPRKRRPGRDDDLSPPRTSKRSEGAPVKAEKTLGGAKAGLSSAAEMKMEAEKLRKKEDKMFAKIDHEALGRDAKTVFRDKSGKRRNLAAEQKEEEEADRKKAEEDKKYQEWGQGLKQKEQREQTMMDYVHEASKPLARYKDDNDLDRMMRDMDREGDPMAMFLKKKKSKKEDPANEKPRYRGPPPPPNRFGIMPGYRWDGVDRSNGFEKQIFSKMSEKKAIKEHAYKWSTEDM